MKCTITIDIPTQIISTTGHGATFVHNTLKALSVGKIADCITEHLRNLDFQRCKGTDLSSPEYEFSKTDQPKYYGTIQFTG